MCSIIFLNLTRDQNKEMLMACFALSHCLKKTMLCTHIMDRLHDPVQEPIKISVMIPFSSVDDIG